MQTWGSRGAAAGAVVVVVVVVVVGRPGRPLRMGAVAWGVLWLPIGLSTVVQIWQLARLSETVVQAGQALESAGSALRAIGRVPLVVEGPRKLGEEVGQTAEEFLARRALQHLPYEALKKVTSDPWGDFEMGRYRLVANAELTPPGLAGTTRTG